MRHAIVLLGLLVGCGGGAFTADQQETRVSSPDDAADDSSPPPSEASPSPEASPPAREAGLPGPTDGGAGDAAPEASPDAGPDLAACQASACAGWSCGSVTTQCDGNPSQRYTFDCGDCAAPAACDDPTPHQCSSWCLDQYASECALAGPYTWGTSGSCNSYGTPYRYNSDGTTTPRPGGRSGCVVPTGLTWLCCP